MCSHRTVFPGQLYDSSPFRQSGVTMFDLTDLVLKMFARSDYQYYEVTCPPLTSRRYVARTVVVHAAADRRNRTAGDVDDRPTAAAAEFGAGGRGDAPG